MIFGKWAFREREGERVDVEVLLPAPRADGRGLYRGVYIYY